MSGLVGLQRGERAPDVVLPAADGTPTRFYARAGGRPTLVVFAGDTPAEHLQALADELGAPPRPDLAVRVIGPPTLAIDEVPFPSFHDPEGAAAAAYRTDGGAAAFLLDQNLRVRAALAFGDAAGLAEQVRDLAAELAWDDARAREVTAQAPVLLVPDVLSPQTCAELMSVWETEGHSETGVEASAGGRRSEELTDQRKRRRDHVVADPQRSRKLGTAIGRRVMPELLKAFAYRASRFEGFKIGCYDAGDRGFFQPHRDNLSPATAHRRFALSLNLNDEYEGGQLRFPEYGPERYRPPAGAALLFSCSHLHEVLDVTAGRRFVLLSFLFGDEARPAP